MVKEGSILESEAKERKRIYSTTTAVGSRQTVIRTLFSHSGTEKSNCGSLYLKEKRINGTLSSDAGMIPLIPLCATLKILNITSYIRRMPTSLRKLFLKRGIIRGRIA